MTPDRSHSDTAGRVANKASVATLTSTFRNISSDALPASDIFIFKKFTVNDCAEEK